MKRFRLSFVVCSMLALFGVVSPVKAQWAVVDVGAIAQLIEQIATLREQLETARDQLEQARQQYDAMTGGRGMDQLLSGTNRNYLPPDWQSIDAALNGAGGSYSALAQDLRRLVDANAVLTPAQVSGLSNDERAQLDAARRSVALMQATNRRALEVTSARFASLQQLISAISTADDQKAVLDLQARITAEQAMLQNEQTKLMVLYQAVQAEELARRQRASELAISNIGSLRRMGPVGLNE